VPLPGAPTVEVLYRRTVNLCQSCVGLGWLAQETTGFILIGLPRSNTLRLVLSCRVLVLGLFVVGVTNWSGEGVRPKSLIMGVWFIGYPTLVTVALLSLL
jgi:hypothetical protein